MPLVLALKRKVPILTCIHTLDELYSQVLLVDSYRSLDFISTNSYLRFYESFVIYIIDYLIHLNIVKHFIFSNFMQNLMLHLLLYNYCFRQILEERKKNYLE